jgi:hypothetical protein
MSILTCWESPNGRHEQASEDTLDEMGASVDANMCVWCLGYDVVPEQGELENYE